MGNRLSSSKCKFILHHNSQDEISFIIAVYTKVTIKTKKKTPLILKIFSYHNWNSKSSNNHKYKSRLEPC